MHLEQEGFLAMELTDSCCKDLVGESVHPVQVNLTRIWVTVSGLLLSFVFVFGNSIKNIYESVVFLFVVRPFDVGDAVLLGPTADWCTVSSLLLL